jgi:hypothetical protein
VDSLKQYPKLLSHRLRTMRLAARLWKLKKVSWFWFLKSETILQYRVARRFILIQKIGYILEGLGMKNVCVFHDHLKYFTVIWYILWSFGIVCVHLVYCSRFGMFGPKKSGNPAPMLLQVQSFFLRAASTSVRIKWMLNWVCLYIPKRG